MQNRFQRITSCLWFDSQAEEAAALYTSIFDNSKILRIARYTKEGAQVSGRKEGSVMTVEFQLDGQGFTALNGGPLFKFSEAISLVVHCHSQQEVDHFWERLSEGGDPAAQQCGWLKDRFGVSWQITPTLLADLMADPDAEKVRRVSQAMFQMKKLDVEALRKAAS